jgi:hypothetical protein
MPQKVHQEPARARDGQGVWVQQQLTGRFRREIADARAAIEDCTMRLIPCIAVFLLGPLLFAHEAFSAPKPGRAAEKIRSSEPSAVRNYQSQHFLIHTDLSAAEAHELLKQLEAELKLISAYWGRPPSGVIEGYVANDFASWPEDYVSQMDPTGVAKIREGAGVCIGKVMSSGNRFVAKCRLFAVARDAQGGQVPLHEAVHAYCQQTFGRSGPRWYAEGMAELGHYWIDNRKGVNAPDVVIRYLCKEKPRKIEELIVTESSTGGTWQDYAWWWFLCHLLENNPNYSAEFRALGPELLAGKDTGFRQVFGAKIDELTFEYDFFLEHLEAGYRVDLCSWDWKRKFFALGPGRSVSATIQANRGWQPSGLTVTAGAKYEYVASGNWSAGKKSEETDADGAADGRGRLVGVLMKGFQLGKEIELGQSGSFIAPSAGNLYLRCRCDWAKIADNSGRIAVKFKSEKK